jgi:hypothetical protein
MARAGNLAALVRPRQIFFGAPDRQHDAIQIKMLIFAQSL